MFYGFVITEAGNRLLANMVAGETLRISKVVMEKGTAANADAARALENPIDPGPQGTTTVPVVDGNNVNMIVEYRSDLNGGLASGFWIGGFGVYAVDPHGGGDIMIYYGSLGDAKQYVSAYTPGTAPDVRRYPVSITVTAGVGAELAYPAEAWMTAEDVAALFNGTIKPDLMASLDGLIEEHDNDENAHQGLRQAVNDAVTAAGAAQTAATAAQQAAEGALTAAGAAQEAAQGAVETAGAAQTSATAALTMAGEAKTAAEGAQEAATAAQEAAESAEAAAASSFTPQILVTTYTGATVTCTKGEKTLTATAENETCAFNIPEYGEWTLTATRNGQQIKTKVIDVQAVIQYREDMKYSRYGYRVKKSESNPAARVEYLFDAVGMTPAHMDFATGHFDYGSWGNIWFVAGNYPCMLKNDGTEDYRLNPNNYALKEGGGNSDVANTNYAGNAMSAIPTCWVKRYEEDGYLYVIFCEKQYDETYKAYAHTDASGTIKAHAYGPMFKGSLISGKLRSLSGQRPDNNRAAEAEVTSATANGTGWNIRTHSLNQLVADLCTLIAKTDNSQDAFGQGHTDGGSSASNLLTTGGLNDKGQFYGTNSNAAVKVFHMENFYADRWDREVGLILDNGVYKVKMTPEGSGYNLTGAGYTTVAHTTLAGTNGGYIIDSTQTEYGRLPQGAISGSDATYECDGCWFNNGIVAVAVVGGDCHDGSPCGLRCLGVNNAAGNASWNIGASLSFV